MTPGAAAGAGVIHQGPREHWLLGSLGEFNHVEIAVESEGGACEGKASGHGEKQGTERHRKPHLEEGVVPIVRPQSAECAQPIC